MEFHLSLSFSCIRSASLFFKLGLRLQKNRGTSHTRLKSNTAGIVHPGHRHNSSLREWLRITCPHIPGIKSCCYRTPKLHEWMPPSTSKSQDLWEPCLLFEMVGRRSHRIGREKEASGTHLQNLLLPLSHSSVNPFTPEQHKHQVPYSMVKGGKCMRSTRHCFHLITTPCSFRPPQ